VSEKLKPQSDSQFSESDRAALDYARSRHKEHQHRAWLWALVKGASKWAAVVAGGLLVLLNTLKAVLQAIRDGL
jgi:hypothetical protein